MFILVVAVGAERVCVCVCAYVPRKIKNKYIYGQDIGIANTSRISPRRLGGRLRDDDLSLA